MLLVEGGGSNGGSVTNGMKKTKVVETQRPGDEGFQKYKTCTGSLFLKQTFSKGERKYPPGN